MKHLVVKPEFADEQTLCLSQDDHHHVVRVMRLGVGAALRLSDGLGWQYEGVIRSIGRDHLLVTLHQRLALPAEPGARLLLIDALGRGERTTLVLQKATELGVDELVPALCERSVARPHDAQHKLRRWQEIVRQAARQCERSRVPLLHPAQSWPQALACATEATLRFVASTDGPDLAQFEDQLRAVTTTVAMAVGPEGGLSSRELTQAEHAGFLPVNLGPRVLRTETAAIVIVTLCAYLSGRLAAASSPSATSDPLSQSR